MTLPLISLVISVACLIYVIRTSRQTRLIMRTLEQQRTMGMDAWLAEQVSRWVNGELQSRLEKSTGASGTDIAIIEPLPGWRICVGTIEQGKRVPFKAVS